MKPLLIYLLLINAAGLLLMLIDKHKAKNNLWRIPERVLLWVAVLGGSLGSLLGMYLFHHKTKHIKFTFLVPLFLFIHMVVFLIFAKYK